MRKQNHFVNSDHYINMCRAPQCCAEQKTKIRSPKTHTLVRFTLVHTKKKPQLYMRMRNISLDTFCLRQNKYMCIIAVERRQTANYI